MERLLWGGWTLGGTCGVRCCAAWTAKCSIMAIALAQIETFAAQIQ